MFVSKWTLCVCVLTCLLSCSVSEGPKEKTVQPGEDVLLPCQDPRGADIIFVKWIRRDLVSEGDVFFFRDDLTYENYQHPSFRGRVELRDPQMKNGDASVILKNVSINDTGRYKCYVRITGSSSEFISNVHLKVQYPDQQQITVKTGDDVTLQCRDPRGGDIELLLWRREDLKENVFVCKHGNMSEDDQHPSFKKRVELRDPEMKDGDVSVILKNVNINDTGTYECYVRNNNTSTPAQIITNIILTVTDSGGDEDGGDKDEGDKDQCLGLIVALSVVTVLLLVVLLLFVGFMIYRKYKRLQWQIYQPSGILRFLPPEAEEKMKEEEETAAET